MGFKKYILIVVFSLLSFTFFSQTQASDIIGCGDNFSSVQQKEMFTMYDLLNKYEDVFENKFPGSSIYIDSFQKVLFTTLFCGTEEKFSDYKGFTIAFKELLTNIIQGKKNVVDNLSQKAVLLLQKHIGDLLFMGVDNNKPFKQTSDTTIVASLQIDDEFNFNANLELQTKGKYDFIQEKFNNNIILNLAMDVLSKEVYQGVDKDGNSIYQDERFAVDAFMDIDLLKKKNLYGKINDFSFDLETNSQDMEVLSFNAIKDIYLEQLHNLEGQYIKLSSKTIPFEQMDFGIEKTINLQKKLQKTPLMNFKKINKNERQGHFTKELCSYLQDISYSVTFLIGSYRTCKDTLNSFEQKHGQEYLSLIKKENTYSFSINTQKDNVIEWDKDTINKFSFPLEGGVIEYKNNILNIEIEDKNSSFIMDGNLKKSKKTFVIDYVDEEELLRAHADITYKKNKNTYDLSAEILVYQDDIEIGKFILHNKEVITYLHSLEINEPKYNKTLEDLEDLFNLDGVSF